MDFFVLNQIKINVEYHRKYDILMLVIHVLICIKDDKECLFLYTEYWWLNLCVLLKWYFLQKCFLWFFYFFKWKGNLYVINIKITLLTIKAINLSNLPALMIPSQQNNFIRPPFKQRKRMYVKSKLHNTYSLYCFLFLLIFVNLSNLKNISLALFQLMIWQNVQRSPVI